MNSSLSNVLSRLEGVRKCGSGWLARCPSHADERPSLSISEGEDGKILLHCHAGCTTEAIVAAMGLETKDLFPEPERKPHRLTRVIATYDYQDASGNLLFQVCRMTPKDFRQRQPCPKGGNCGEVDEKGRQVCWQDPDGRWWHWNLKGVHRVLYRLPEVLKAVQQGETVFIPEGEKDCDNLARLGLVATTSPMGAGKWRDHYSDWLKGADVVVLPDNDEPGRKHAQRVAQSLYGKATSVKVLELPGPPPKGDVSDWLAAGGSIEELLELVQECPTWEPEITSDQEEGESEKQQRKTQAQVLVASATGGELFHTPDLVCYASIPVADHKETWPVKAKGFRPVLTHQKSFSTLATKEFGVSFVR